MTDSYSRPRSLPPGGRQNPALLMSLIALSLAAGEASDAKPLTPEERERRDAERDELERRRRASAEQDRARRQAEEDAAAAPYREARRRRHEAKLAKGCYQ